MADEDPFAAPPEEAPPAEAPTIILGGEAPPGDFAAPPVDDFAQDFAAPAAAADEDAFLGNVDETTEAAAVPSMEPPMDDGAPIVLGEAPPVPVEEPQEEAALVLEEPPVPSGPSPMQIWNEEWQEVLKERKDAENAKKAEFVEAARADMETFHAQRDQKREQKMAKNRADEQEKLEAIEADLENDNSWQRVCKMVELQHETVEEGADVKRMRDVFILLKNDPVKAVELAA